jgi:hypothetical protein
MKGTLFKYLYRDAGNFKAFGCLALEGALTLAEQHILRSRFPGDGLFIAEQLGVPPLYNELYRWSGGPTLSDHCWHEFDDVKVIEDSQVPAGASRSGPAKAFLARLLAVSFWDEGLSPHFWLEA